MCLSRIDPELARQEYGPYYMTPNEPCIGWKRFIISKPKSAKPCLNFESHGLIDRHDLSVPLDSWLKATPRTIEIDGHTSYEAGFHIYLHEPALVSTHEIMVLVHYRNVICTGWQRYHNFEVPAVVAREMYVPGGLIPCGVCKRRHRAAQLRLVNPTTLKRMKGFKHGFVA
jgi:hypothetical protein